jgi:UDP-N-acetylmuramate--alanine ligase
MNKTIAEIKATANAIKNKSYNESWVIFQPHTYSRTKEHLDAFANSLLGFDNIILLDIYAAREKNTFDISSKDLENKINSLVPNKAIYMPDFNEVVSYLKENISENN